MFCQTRGLLLNCVFGVYIFGNTHANLIGIVLATRCRFHGDVSTCRDNPRMCDQTNIQDARNGKDYKKFIYREIII